jgi:hypothetical protein
MQSGRGATKSVGCTVLYCTSRSIYYLKRKFTLKKTIAGACTSALIVLGRPLDNFVQLFPRDRRDWQTEDEHPVSSSLPQQFHNFARACAFLVHFPQTRREYRQVLQSMFQEQRRLDRVVQLPWFTFGEFCRYSPKTTRTCRTG